MGRPSSFFYSFTFFSAYFRPVFLLAMAMTVPKEPSPILPMNWNRSARSPSSYRGEWL
jgi:hypothetical protein